MVRLVRVIAKDGSVSFVPAKDAPNAAAKAALA